MRNSNERRIRTAKPRQESNDPNASVPRQSRLLRILNQPIILFIFGTIAVGILTSLITERRQCVRGSRDTIDSLERVVAELRFRTIAIDEEMESLEDPAQRLQRLIYLRSAEAPSLFSEFSGDRYAAMESRLELLSRNLEIQWDADFGSWRGMHSPRAGGRRMLVAGFERRDAIHGFGPLPTVNEVTFVGRTGQPSDAKALLMGERRSVLSGLVREGTAPHTEQILMWLGALSRTEHLRVKGGCGFGRIIRTALGTFP